MHRVAVLKDMHWGRKRSGADLTRYQGGEEVVKFVQNAEGRKRGERLAIGERGDAAALPLDAPERFKVYRRATLELRAGVRARHGERKDARRAIA